jgi:glucose/arabinose dehydrogenase
LVTRTRALAFFVAGFTGLAAVAVVITLRAGSADGFASQRVRAAATPATLEPWGPALDGATDIVGLPDGRALVSRKGGWQGAATAQIFMVEESLAAEPALALDLPVCADAERGLIGLAIDPSFASNGYVYVNYVRQMNGCATAPFGQPLDAGVFARVSRFTLEGNFLNPASELVLLDGIDANQSAHVGGGLAFLGDGTLLIGVGEGTRYLNFEGGSPTPLASYSGNILRIDPRTPGQAPHDNPFASTPYDLTTPANAIWATGFRNPFRIAVDGVTGAVFVADVGTDEFEEVNLAQVGVDYGYPLIEGPGSVNGSRSPAFWYRHQGNCNAVIGGAAIDGSVLGAEGRRAFVFADFGCTRVWAGILDEDQLGFDEVRQLADVGYNASSIAALADGRLVVLALGRGEPSLALKLD